jgi:hypothetical protein
MAVTNSNGSRRRAQVRTESSDSLEKINKTKLQNKAIREVVGPLDGKKRISGALWKFTACRITADKEPAVHRVVSTTLEEALKYMQRYHGNFLIEKVEHKGLIWILSSWPSV